MSKSKAKFDLGHKQSNKNLHRNNRIQKHVLNGPVMCGMLLDFHCHF